MSSSINIRTLTDGGQQPAEVAHEVAGFLSAAKHSLDLAQYDFNLGPETGAGHAADRGSRGTGQGDRGRARPDAPQVRRARQRERADRLDQLDRRLLVAAGERRRDDGLARARPRV